MKLTHLPLFAALALAGLARATPITFTGSGTNSIGNAISASATFDTSVANHLSITLTNTDTQLLHLGGADILTGLYFNLGTGASLTVASAGLSPNSATILLNGSTTPNLQANWGYFNSPALVGKATTGDQAVAATGLIGGTNYDFTGVYHGSSGYLKGPAYGIVGNPDDYTGGVGCTPLEANGVTFNFTYTGTISSITGVAFIYGTSSNEGSFTGHLVPPPSVPDGANTVALLGAALIGVAAFRRQRRTR